MAELKTKATGESVEDFIDAIDDEQKRDDCRKIAALMSKVTKSEPKMWGASMVGFGDYHYKYESGREGDVFLIGFSPRKQNLTLYVTDDFPKYGELLSRLGKHKTGKSCLYFKKLSDVDFAVLEELVNESVKNLKKN